MLELHCSVQSLRRAFLDGEGLDFLLPCIGLDSIISALFRFGTTYGELLADFMVLIVFILQENAVLVSSVVSLLNNVMLFSAIAVLLRSVVSE